MVISSGGEDAVALTVFRRLGGNALAISERAEQVLADAAKSAPPGVKIEPIYDQGLLVRTAIANVRDAIVIGGCLSVLVLLVFLKSWRATLIGVGVDSAEPGDHVRLSLPDRRHAELDVAGWAGRGDRTDHRRHRGGGRKHRPASGRGANGRRGGRRGQPRNQRRRGRLDVDHDPGFFAVGAGQRRGGAVFSIAEHCPDRGVAGLDGHQLDDHPGVGGPLSGPAQMPATGPTLQFAGRSLRGAAAARGCAFPWPPVLVAVLAAVPGWLLFGRLETGFMPEMDEGAFVIDYTCRSALRWPRPTRSLRRVEDDVAARRPTFPATSAAPGPSWVFSPPSRTPATSWSASSLRASGARPARSSKSLREELAARRPGAGDRDRFRW